MTVVVGAVMTGVVSAVNVIVIKIFVIGCFLYTFFCLW